MAIFEPLPRASAAEPEVEINCLRFIGKAYHDFLFLQSDAETIDL